MLTRCLIIALINLLTTAFTFAQPTPTTRPATRPTSRPALPVRQERTLISTYDPATGKMIHEWHDGPLPPEVVDPSRIRKPLRNLTGHIDTIRAVALSADGTKLLTGGNDLTVRLWDFATGKEIHRFEGHSKFVRSVGFSSDATRIISAGDDSTVRIWNAASGEQLAQLEGHQRGVIAASFLTEPNLAISASADATARLWDIDTEKTIKRFDHDRQICAMALCLPQNLLAVGTHSGHVFLWDLKKRTQLREINAARNCIEALAISNDGKKLVVCPASQLFRVMDSATGKVLFCEDEKDHESIWTAAISPDDQLLALGRGPEVIFYNLKTFKQYKTTVTPGVFVQSMIFVPGTPLLITAGGGFRDTTDNWTRPHGEMLQIFTLPQPLP